MEFIANIIGISVDQAWGLLGTFIIIAVVGCTLKYAWKFAMIGAVAVICIAFMHEHSSWSLRGPTAQEPQAALNPQIVELVPASEPEAASEAASEPVAASEPTISDEERAFIENCKANGDGDTTDDCMNLYAEKRYIADEQVSQPASEAVAPAAHDNNPAPNADMNAFLYGCMKNGWTPFSCRTYWDRAHPG
jgi:hypothetical protein